MQGEKQLPWVKEALTELRHLEEISQTRKLTTTECAYDPWLRIDGKEMLNLASNNYMGYAGDERIKNAMIDAIHTYGAGATASRLIVGNHPLYEETESKLLSWKNAEAGIIVNSGYTANVSIISALAGRGDFVYSDKLNHASIVDGTILSRAKFLRYRHNDLDHLESMLKKNSNKNRHLIVTDSLFSMDGDFAHLKELVQLKEQYHALLMVDEAHATGVFGKKGEGYSYHLELQDKVDIHMGTFSKALGGFGAYIVGKSWLIDYLSNRMRGFIYSTALPPAILGAAKAAIELAEEDQERRTLLHDHAAHFRRSLTDYGFTLCGSQSQIVPIMIGSNEKTIKFAELLRHEGIAAIAIRPPTVPENQARIRFTITADHRKQDIEWAAEKVALVGAMMGVIG
ncbi:8-amino-7-oxononanoate synthase [Bacillus pakistanensis]|uniref:8-amino-7-ketopelargonate synthase n=1 Tax=Rossellomorea pakistanensis TaxID=992288 RepID=A0ABS2NJ61_9BACI|nr:8-amino-7-oxononanoate synthase [Bacillus pakistanensis]MBM7587896.1 8-amino-7-oxononanoate synthase [Bacillus pakistanensis]